MPAPVVHFEIGSKDTAATAAFYGAVFDWRFGGDGPARFVTGGHEGGPTGMLNALGHPPDDIAATLERVAAAGGVKLVGPIPLPDGRRFAWIQDPAGNAIGLLTPP
jgi:predicted enzyme related to lactoylglutathione lyase